MFKTAPVDAPLISMEDDLIPDTPPIKVKQEPVSPKKEEEETAQPKAAETSPAKPKQAKRKRETKEEPEADTPTKAKKVKTEPKQKKQAKTKTKKAPKKQKREDAAESMDTKDDSGSSSSSKNDAAAPVITTVLKAQEGTTNFFLDLWHKVAAQTKLKGGRNSGKPKGTAVLDLNFMNETFMTMARMVCNEGRVTTMADLKAGFGDVALEILSMNKDTIPERYHKVINDLYTNMFVNYTLTFFGLCNKEATVIVLDVLRGIAENNKNQQKDS